MKTESKTIRIPTETLKILEKMPGSNFTQKILDIVNNYLEHNLYVDNKYTNDIDKLEVINEYTNNTQNLKEKVKHTKKNLITEYNQILQLKPGKYRDIVLNQFIKDNHDSVKQSIEKDNIKLELEEASEELTLDNTTRKILSFDFKECHNTLFLNNIYDYTYIQYILNRNNIQNTCFISLDDCGHIYKIQITDFNKIKNL